MHIEVSGEVYHWNFSHDVYVVVQGNKQNFFVAEVWQGRNLQPLDVTYDPLQEINNMPSKTVEKVDAYFKSVLPRLVLQPTNMYRLYFDQKITQEPAEEEVGRLSEESDFYDRLSFDLAVVRNTGIYRQEGSAARQQRNRRFTTRQKAFAAEGLEVPYASLEQRESNNCCSGCVIL